MEKEKKKENCAVLGFLLRLFTLEDWTDRLSRNAGKELPLLTA